MSLVSLIKDQVIKIDDHLWGTKEPKSFNGKNKDVHLDKRTNFKMNGKLQHVIIKISLNNDRKISVTINNKKTGEIPKKLINEIQNTLTQDDHLTRKFFEDVAQVIGNYESFLTDEIKCIDVFDRIAKNFGLTKTGNEIFNSGSLYQNTFKHSEYPKNTFLVKMSKNSIKIGEKSGDFYENFKDETNTTVD